MSITCLLGDALINTTELSGSIGLIATVILTLNMVLGIMLSTSFKKTNWGFTLPSKIKALDIYTIHNYTAYIALLLVFIHIILIPLDAATQFTFWDLIWPIHTAHQPKIVLLGTISLLALLVVIITTQKSIKKRMPFRLWKNIHLLSYGTCIVFIIHGLLMDPALKDRPIDWLDGEKILSEICGFVLLLAFILRYKYYIYSTRNK